MPANVIRRTPGVYVTELAAFPPSIVGVQTAVPAFIGYTATAAISGKPVFMKPIKIGSMADFENIFGGPFKPLYEIEAVTSSPIQADDYDFKVLDVEASPPAWEYYKLTDSTAVVPLPSGSALAALDAEPAPQARFNLYNSMRLFYANGGGNSCYVVSVGSYNDAALAGVDATLLSKGLDVIQDQPGPTMLVVPDAVLLKPTGSPPQAPQAYWDLMNQMIDQAGTKQDRVAILDVYGSHEVTDQRSLDAVVTDFQSKVNSAFLSYGMAYFPFLQTSVVPASEIDYQNVASGASFTQLQTILGWQNTQLYGGGSPPSARYTTVQGFIDAMQPARHYDTPEEKAAAEAEVKILNQNLVAVLPVLDDVERILLAKNQVLPPSGAMAGVYTFTDTTRGVWNAPANIALNAVVQPTYKLTGEQQGDLNLPVDGKAIDAIRELTGRGTVVWGARTLDGNSNDYRYVQVRRTLIYIEQSIKQALDQFVFAPNDGNTWSTVVAMVSSFLQGFWSQGGLMGATASEAFSVQCGIGSTMTAQDILDGYMRVQVVLQMIRPAEFIELTFTQKMEGAG